MSDPADCTAIIERIDGEERARLIDRAGVETARRIRRRLEVRQRLQDIAEDLFGVCDCGMRPTESSSRQDLL